MLIRFRGLGRFALCEIVLEGMGHLPASEPRWLHDPLAKMPRVARRLSLAGCSGHILLLVYKHSSGEYGRQASANSQRIASECAASACHPAAGMFSMDPRTRQQTLTDVHRK